MLLEGLFIPLTTPFHPDGRLHPTKLAANVLRYSKSPASGLIALAPRVGEPTLLTDEETCTILRTVAEAAAPEKVLLANISRDSVSATLALAHTAADLHYDAVLVGVPSILAGMGGIAESSDGPNVPVRELLTYFRVLADASRIPLVLLSDGMTRGRAFAPALAAELATHPNIIGLLDSSSDSTRIASLVQERIPIRREVTVTPVFSAVTTRMQLAAAHAAARSNETLISAASLAHNPAAAATAVAEPQTAVTPLRTRSRTVGFQILTTSAAGLLESLRRGATGIAPGFAACAPQACYEVYAAWKDDDQPLADEKQQRIDAAAQLTETHGPAALKCGCDFNGYFGGLPRLPQLQLDAAQRTQLHTAIAPMRT